MTGFRDRRIMRPDQNEKLRAMDKVDMEKANLVARLRKVVKIQQTFLIAYGGLILLTIAFLFSKLVADVWGDLFSSLSPV